MPAKKKDGDDASSGVSYLEIVEFLMQYGANPKIDLEELWKQVKKWNTFEYVYRFFAYRSEYSESNWYDYLKLHYDSQKNI